MTIDEFGDGRAWSLISNHGHALVCLAQQPDVRLWEQAETIGIRERSAQRIVNQLVDAGYVTRHQHDHLGAHTVGDLNDAVSRPPTPGEAHDGSDAAT